MRVTSFFFFLMGHVVCASGKLSPPRSVAAAKGPRKQVTPETRVRGGSGHVSGLTALAHSLVGVAVETPLLLGLIVGAKRVPPSVSDLLVRLKILPSETVRGLSAAEWAACFVVIFGSSVIGGIADGGLRVASNQILMPTSVAGNPEWYKSLDRPDWEPPGWVFPIMWLLISKPTQLLALSRICHLANAAEEDLPWLPLSVYCAHLALGDAWNKVFFGQQQVKTGVLVITIFYAALCASAFLFYDLDQVAGLYMLPTVLWVTVATSLNWSIYLRLQSPAPPAETETAEGEEGAASGAAA